MKAQHRNGEKCPGEACIALSRPGSMMELGSGIKMTRKPRGPGKTLATWSSQDCLHHRLGSSLLFEWGDDGILIVFWSGCSEGSVKPLFSNLASDQIGLKNCRLLTMRKVPVNLRIGSYFGASWISRLHFYTDKKTSARDRWQWIGIEQWPRYADSGRSWSCQLRRYLKLFSAADHDEPPSSLFSLSANFRPFFTENFPFLVVNFFWGSAVAFENPGDNIEELKTMDPD